ncbi:MAG: c-type cytochrome [Rhizobacter sp.]
MTPRGSPRHRLLLALLVPIALASVLAGCYREKRDFGSPTPNEAPVDPGKSTSLRPGTSEPVRPGPTAAPEKVRYEGNAYHVNQGKRLFRWYNCAGCHSQGGGGMGPALTDGSWLYGGAPEQIFATIVQGRPNGMPAFGGRIPEDQLWELVAYVRSMSGQLRKDVAPSRADSLAGVPPENTRPEEKPVPTPPKERLPNP